MKKITLLSLAVLLTQISFSQIMSIHKKDQTKTDFSLSLIDSITFTWQDTTQADTGVMMPLKIGNQWEYKISSLDSSGNTTYSDTVVLVIIGDTTILGEKWYALEFDGYTTGEYLTNRTDGLWYNSRNTSMWTPVLFAKYPASINDTYLSYDSTHLRVLSINQIISVPGGIFSCYEYEQRSKYDNSVEVIRYFSPGIGLVRDDFYFHDYVSTKRELISMSVNTADVVTKTIKRNTASGVRFFFGNR